MKWFRQHERVEKLNMQAIYSASVDEHEFVNEYLVSMEKIPVLIHQLICLQIWKEKIFPHFKKGYLNISTAFPVHTALHGELTICNLLETVLYHEDTCESMGDSAIELVDCVCRVMHTFIAAHVEDESKGALGDTAENEYKKELDVDELVRIEKKIKFDVFVKCLSIIRYIIQHMITVNLSVTARIISVHDIPVTLAKIIQLRPWIRKSTEKGQIYVEGQWKEMSQEDILIVSKIDGQVNPRNRVVHVAVGGIVIVIKKEDVPCELRSMLNTVIIQQLPVLEEFRRFLEQLSISEPAPTKPLLILEQVPVFYEGMLKKYSQKQWKEIAEHHIKTFLSASKEKILHQAKMLAEVYNPEDLEALISTMPKCAVCGEDAPKRCSRCKNEWYCRRYIFFYSADSAKWNIGQDTARRATSCNDVFCIRVSSMYGIVQIHEL
ncbi:Zinc finger MYND domain-containing protein 10 [Nymphon striatum]|nr:Zinc finger MYND domain-containing protein 10 [Nymphon striatum]